MTQRITLLLIGFVLFINLHSLYAQNQPTFAQSELNLNGNTFNFGVTSLMYGPDGKLYTSEYPSGVIKIFTVARNNQTNYDVVSTEILDGITTMVDHNDDGVFNSNVNRQVTGLTLGGTSSNPIVYVSSSDVRIGSGVGGGNGDIGLDTNSGVITRMIWNGTSWDVVDLVRGLPRSEENHSTNGLELTTINGTNYLIVASGGFTNAGAPSTNFVYTCEYALSGAVLSIDLDAINALPILDDNGRSYIYDLPTLDDPTRANVNGITDPNDPGYDGIDVNDPFGGNDGLNQAMVVPGGPVQIFSPGYRNTYDLVVTESGALYVTDNGANQGWGGFPENEGGGSATNNYDPAEPGSQSASGGELIDNVDHLELVTTDLQTYVPGSFYGGHPNPTRANPTGAGLYVAPNQNGNGGAVFRTLTYDPDGTTPGSTTDVSIALPANWPPVQVANPVEGDWRGPTVANPDGPDDNPVAIWGTNTNGIDEYTASNFGGAMQGNLLAGHNGGNVRRVQLNTDGSLQNLDQIFLSGLGGNALGITCNSDSDIFPGTIWAGTLNGKIVVFEPQDFLNCIDPGQPGYDANADYDDDGYTNQDEEDNGTDPCNGGSQPTDFDKVAGGSPLTSDLNDTDDDADGILDANDPFQLGDPTTAGSDAFALPISNDLFNDQQGLGGIFGLGMTGLMNNGDTGANWLDWIDDIDAGPNPNDVLGGAPGLMTSHMTSGTALGTTNTQEKGYQFGVQTSTATGQFTVTGNLINLTGPLRIYGNTAAVGGELGHFIGDGTQSNYIKIVLTTNGITALQEINDVPQTPINVPIAVVDRPTSGILFYFVVDPTNGEVTLEYAIDGGTRNTIGTITAQGSILNAIQQANQDLAVGFIGTSNTTGVELEGTWDFIGVEKTQEELLVPLAINSGGSELDFNGKTYGNDVFFINGREFENQEALVPEIYKTERSSLTKTFSYDIPLENGDYIVDLHFVEIYWGATEGGPGAIGSRVFDVIIEDNLVLNDYDIFAEVGAENIVVKSYAISVSDGILEIDFSALSADGGVDQPKVAAIEIRENSNQSNPLNISPIADQNNIIDDNVNFGVTVTGGDSNANFSYGISGQPTGVVIEPTNGLISGIIDPVAINGGVNNDGIHNVTITVSKIGSDPVFEDFIWTIKEVGWRDKNENESYEAKGESGFVQAGNKFYIIGGLESKNVFSYDYISDKWNDLGEAPLLFNHFQPVAYNGLIWVIGALKNRNYPSDSPSEFVWIFDPIENTWTQGPAVPASRVRGSAGLVLHNDKFYLIGGTTNGHNGGYVSWLDEFNPQTGEWRELPDAPRPRDHFYAIEANNKIYTIGGRLTGGTGGFFGPDIPEVDVFDFTTETWSSLPSNQNMPTPRAGAPVALYEDMIVVMGGEIDNAVVYGEQLNRVALQITEGFDLNSNTWSRLDDTIFPRHGTNAINSGNGVYLASGAGGWGDSPAQQNMEFYGMDNPSGEPLVKSEIIVPSSLLFADTNPKQLTIETANGNTALFVRSVEIVGNDAIDFQILDGNLQNQLLSPNNNYQITLAVTNLEGPKDAFLRINYNDASSKDVVLNVSPDSPQITWEDKNENENYTGRHECSFVQAGDKFYLMGGREQAKNIDVYDYQTNSWSTLINSAPFEFNHFQAVEYQGLIWVIGAFETNNFPNETSAAHIWTFDPANEEWILGPVIPEERRRGSAALVVYDDKFYIVGGNTDGHSGGFVPFFDEYDPATATWTSLTDAPRARDHFHAAVIDEKLYLSGGRQTSSSGGYFSDTLSEVDVYDFSTNSWNTLLASQNLPTERAGAAVANFNDNLVVIGGEISGQFSALKTTEQYNPVLGEWEQLPDLNYPRHSSQAIVSGNGIIIAAGSPNQGAGNQKNMEILGEDDPTGIALVASTLTGPSLVAFDENNVSTLINLDISGGNSGIILKSMNISGPDAADFSITSGQIMDGLLKANSSFGVGIEYSGNTNQANAELTVNYGKNDQLIIPLEATNTVTDPVTTFTLVDTETNSDLFDITDGQQIDANTIAGLSLNIRANPIASNVGSVYFELSGALTNTRTENVAVYALYGDVAGDYYGVDFPLGDYTMTATVYSGGNQSGTVLESQTINFSIVLEEVENNAPVVTNPGTQNNDEGDVVSLQIQATDDGSNLTYTATNLPTGLSIDENTGLISGTISGLSESAYNVLITVTDDGTPALNGTTEFVWNVAELIMDYSLIVNNGSGSGQYEAGTTVSIVADAAPANQEFDIWTGDISGIADVNSASTSIIMPSSNITIIATYKDVIDPTPTLYALTVNNGSGSGQYEAGTTVSIVADAAPVNQEFDIWTGDISGIADVNSASTSITMPAINTSVSATYKDVVVDPVTTFTLVNAETNSDLFDITDGQQIDANTIAGLSLNIRANPVASNVGSVYFELSGALTNTRTENVAVYALYGDVAGDYYGVDFPLGDYTMTATVYSGGNQTGTLLETQTINFSIILEEVENNAPVVTNPGTQNNDEGDMVSLQIQATDDGSNLTYAATNLPTGLSIDENTGLISGTISGLSESAYNVLITVIDDGTPALNGTTEFVWNVAELIMDYSLIVNNGSGSGQYEAGTTVSIVADAGPINQEFDIWTGDISGIADVNSASTSITMPATNTSVSATYKDVVDPTPTLYALTVNNGSGSGQYEAGTTVSIFADAAPVNQEFDIWTGDITGIADVNSASTSITMPATNTLVSATYKDIVVDPIMTFTLVNAETNSDLFDITDGQQIDANTITGLSLNIRANPIASNVGSVYFELSGALTNTRTENVAVYALYGDVAGNYYGVDFPLGNYTMTATVYSGGNQSGTVLETQTINFSIILEEVENNAPVVTNPGTQNNDEGDMVSLQIQAIDEGSNLTYTATNLPTGLSIDANTGLISGTILSEDSVGGAFQESNGLLVIEAESGTIMPGWSETNASGATGIIASTNSFNSQSGGMIPYEIEINTPGVYRFVWRNFFSGSNPTDENDSWLKFPNNDDVWFFAHRGTIVSEASLISNVQGSQSNILFPKGSSRVSVATSPEGAGANGYFKAYRSGGLSESYSWQALTNDGLGYQIYVWFVNPGTYTMQIAERSSGHAIDKIAMYKVDGPKYTSIQLTAANESITTGGGNGAAASSPYDVIIDVSDDGIPVLTSNIEFVWNVGINTDELAGRGGSVESNYVGAYIYPNPASGSIYINPLSENSMITKVILYDFAGRKIKTLNQSQIELTEQGVKFPLDNIGGGSYLLQLYFDNFETRMLKVLVRD